MRMDETGGTILGVGRPAKTSTTGERLATFAVRAYPSEWQELGDVVGDRSAYLRRAMQRAIRAGRRRKSRATIDQESSAED